MKYFKFFIANIALIFIIASSLRSTERCENYNNQRCDSGYCISKYNYCGTREENCSKDKGCQSKFGECKDYSGDSKATTIKSIGMLNTGPGGDCSTEMSIAFHSPYLDNFVEYTEASDTEFENAKKYLLLEHIEMKINNLLIQMVKVLHFIVEKYILKIYPPIQNIFIV